MRRPTPRTFWRSWRTATGAAQLSSPSNFRWSTGTRSSAIRPSPMPSSIASSTRPIGSQGREPPQSRRQASDPLWRRRQLTPTRTPPNQVADIIGMPGRLQLVQVAGFVQCAAGPSLSCRWVHAHRRSADRRSCRPRIGPPGGSLLGRCRKNRSWLDPPGKPLRRQIEK